MARIHHPPSPRSNFSPNQLWARQCISCPDTPTCNCAANEDCVLTSRTCSQCPQIRCLPKESDSAGSGGSGGGINPGIIAGPVVAVVVLVAISGGLWWLWKRKRARDLAALREYEKRASQQAARSPNPSHHRSPLTSPRPDLGPPSRNNPGFPNSMSGEFPTDVRPSMDTIGGLGFLRPNTGVTKRVYVGDTDINLRQHGEDGDENNPFDDRRSIQTDQLSFGSTNVIPITFVPPSDRDGEGNDGRSGPGGKGRSLTAGEKLDAARRALGVDGVGPPRRPARSPDLDLRLQQVGKGGKPPSAFNPELMETLEQDPYGRSRDGNSSRISVLTSRTGVSVAPSFISANEAVVQRAAVVDVSGRHLTVDTVGMQGGTASPGKESHLSMDSGSSDPFSDQKADRFSAGTFGGMLGGSNEGHGQSQPRGVDPRSSGYSGFDSTMGMGENDIRYSVGSEFSMGQFSMGQVNHARVVKLGPTSGVQMPEPPRDSMMSGQGGKMPRESMMSDRSGRSDDSFLNAIIPPPFGNTSSSPSRVPSQSRQHMPSSMSNMSFPNARFSDARSPPDAEPSGGNPNRNTLGGQSAASEGLSDFDFRVEGDLQPPLPEPRAR